MHVVKYYESERGWGSETYYRSFETEQEARLAVHEVNSKNTAKEAPDFYVVASYEGIKDKLPTGYKQ